MHAEPVSGAPADAAFDAIVSAAFATQTAPGVSVAIVRGGTTVYAKQLGFADVERKRPVDDQTRFAAGSLTKQFTAAAILLLAEQKKLGLDDTLATYLPALPNAPAITLRMLLNHTSGLHNYPFMNEHAWPIRGPITNDAVLAFLATDKPDFSPGALYNYSNANYAALAGVIQRVAGVDEGTFLARNIFGPLKMTSTGCGFAAQQNANVAQPYGLAGAATVARPLMSLDLYSGAGALVTTARDLAAWDSALMHGALLSAASLHELWTPGKLNSGQAVNYAMGFVPAQINGHRELWHNGVAPGAGGYCFNAIFPDDNLAVVILSNGEAFSGQPERMVAQILAHAFPAAIPSAAPGEDLAVTARAKDWWHRLASGTVDLGTVTPAFAARLTPEFLTAVQLGLSTLGDPTDWIYQGADPGPDVTIYHYWIRLNGAAHGFDFGLSGDGKIAGSLLK